MKSIIRSLHLCLSQEQTFQFEDKFGEIAAKSTTMYRFDFMKYNVIQKAVWQNYHGIIENYCFEINAARVERKICNIPWVHRGFSRTRGRPFKNTYELLNLRAHKFSPVNRMHIFQCMGKIFRMEFQMVPLKFHTKYLIHTLKDKLFMKHWNVKSS